jgi:flagellar hook-associated protein 2
MVRIGGLASGMDIDSLVADLMKAERMPLDKLKQNKQTLEWQRDGYREMNSLLFAFRNATFDMKLSSNYRARATNSSNSDKVTATATSSASTSSYSISKVEQLATAATKVNAGAISASGSKVNPSKSLYEMKDSFANQNFNWQTGTVKNQTITADADGSTFNLKLKMRS